MKQKLGVVINKPQADFIRRSTSVKTDTDLDKTKLVFERSKMQI